MDVPYLQRAGFHRVVYILIVGREKPADYAETLQKWLNPIPMNSRGRLPATAPSASCFPSKSDPDMQKLSTKLVSVLNHWL
jgi:hypothetical protein